VANKINETLSAWLDDEASEIEIHRLLRHFESDDSVLQTGLGYQQCRALAQGDTGPSLGQHLALHQRISAAIDSEEVTHAGSRGLRKASTVTRLTASLPSIASNWARPAGGLALAASLVVAVFIGLQPGQVDSLESAASSTATSITGPAGTAPISVQTVGTRSGQQDSRVNYGDTPAYQFDKQLANDQTDLKALDEDKQRQLRAYLRQHDQMARMNPNPNTRTVIYEAPKGAEVRKK
jgi:negative regulator of sigma E activity